MDIVKIPNDDYHVVYDEKFVKPRYEVAGKDIKPGKCIVRCNHEGCTKYIVGTINDDGWFVDESENEYDIMCGDTWYCSHHDYDFGFDFDNTQELVDLFNIFKIKP